MSHLELPEPPLESSSRAASPPVREAARKQPASSRRHAFLFGGAVLAVGIVGLLWFERTSFAHGEPAGEAHIVAVAKVVREDLAQSLTISAEFRPYQQVALHSKVAGYLQSISVDVGDHVKEGQAIAQLDIPELHDELEKATAAVQASEQEVLRAEAGRQEVQLNYERLQEVAKQQPRLVAVQELDSARARDAAAAGALAAAKQRVAEARAEMNKVRSTIAYTTIAAPFDGVITKRFVDPGALVQAGTSSSAQLPVVNIEEDKRLRLVFPVPESSVSKVSVGAPVRISVTSINATIEGKVARYSGKVDRTTRTMSTEVDVDNSNGLLKPGMYARVDLIIREKKGAIAVPVQALTSGTTPKVFVVAPTGILEERPVQLDLQTPAMAEVTSGLAAGDLVIIGSRSGLQAGQKVSPKLTELTPAG